MYSLVTDYWLLLKTGNCKTLAMILNFITLYDENVFKN